MEKEANRRKHRREVPELGSLEVQLHTITSSWNGYFRTWHLNVCLIIRRYGREEGGVKEKVIYNLKLGKEE